LNEWYSKKHFQGNFIFMKVVEEMFVKILLEKLFSLFYITDQLSVVVFKSIIMQQAVTDFCTMHSIQVIFIILLSQYFNKNVQFLSHSHVKFISLLFFHSYTFWYKARPSRRSELTSVAEKSISRWRADQQLIYCDRQHMTSRDI